MRKENSVLILENEEDKDLLFDYFDNYIEFWNYDGDDDSKDDELTDNLNNSRNEFKDYIDKKNVENIFKIFISREEFNVTLFPKALKCLETLDLVKVEYKKEPKYKLTKNTYTLLSMMMDGVLSRDEDGTLYYFDKSPHKDKETRMWVFYSGDDGIKYNIIDESVFNVNFSFIKWEDAEPTKISDILSDCEIIEEE